MDEAVPHGVLRKPLHVQIERRIDVHRLRRRRREARVLIGERLLNEVDEVRRLGLERALHDDERLVRGAIREVLVDVAGVDHRLQNDVPLLLAPRGIRERRQRRRRLEDAGDRRRLGERHVRHVLAEEQPRRFRDADDAERAALAERQVVQVHLEDFVLRRAHGDDERHPRLEDLAPPRFLARVLERHAGKHLRQKDVARDLLRDGAAAGRVRALAAQVGERGAEDADRIDARMLVEASVLGREHRLLDALRDRGQRHRPPLLAFASVERRQHRRVEHEPLARPGADLEPQHAVRRPRRRPGARRRLHRRRRRLKDDADDLLFELRRARVDRDGAAADGELARLLELFPVRIAEVVEPVDELPLGERLAAAQLERTRENAREHRFALAVQPRVDQVCEADVVIGRDEAEHDGRYRRGERGETHPPLPPQRSDTNAQNCSRGLIFSH